jgi:hypothetical protein
MLQDFQERNNQMVGELGSIDASKQAQWNGKGGSTSEGE